MLFSAFRRPNLYKYGAKKIEVRKRVDHFIPVVAIVAVVVIVETLPFVVVVVIVEALSFVVVVVILEALSFVVVVVILEALPFVVKAMGSTIAKTMAMTSKTNNATITGLNHFD